MSRQSDIRDAVAAEMRSHAFSLGFVVETSYKPIIERENASILEIYVAPGGVVVEPVTRDRIRQKTQIDLVIDKGVGGPDDEVTLDRLTDLVEEISDYWILRAPATYAAATCLAVESTGPEERTFDDATLARQHLFVATLRLTFQHSVKVK